jgi:hypothetical protein
MALARNLHPQKRSIKKFKLPKISKRNLVILVALVAILLGGLGWWSLSKATKNSSKKIEVKYDTGDKPLPQAESIWINADGGLFMRQDANAKSKIVIIIPNGTQLTVIEKNGTWYKVSYMNKTGWVSNQYVVATAPAQDPTKAWKTYQNAANNYSLRYPTEWVTQDYGPNPASGSTSYVAFGPLLAPALDPNNLPPVIIRVSSATADAAAASYKAASGSIATPATVSGLPATVYTYTAGSGVQMTAYIVAKGPRTFIIEENGGYADQLQKIIGSLSLG